MKIRRIECALVCSILIPSAALGATKPIDLCDFSLVMNENFSHFTIEPHILDGARWTAHTPWNGDFGAARFADPGPGGPFSVSSEGLSITASRNPDGSWQSGLIAAADSTGAGTGVLEGYFVARMRLPPGPGTWPAFWLSTLKPASDPSPGIEIDAIEYYGHDTSHFQSAVHVWYSGAQQSKSTQVLHQTQVKPEELVSGFHNYGVQIDATEITFYLDGEPIWSQPRPAELTRPMFPLVDMALGSGYPITFTPDPSVLNVQFVRMFNYDPRHRQERCPQ